MFKTGIQWLMILLIAMQSVGSLADAHSTHQSGLKHIEFEHDHAQARHEQAKQISNDGAQFDCHHCCHCHGAHSNIISSYHHSFAVFARSPQHSFEPTLALSQQAQSLYRPPRHTFEL